MKRRDNKRKKRTVSSVEEDDDGGSRLWFGEVLIEQRFEFGSNVQTVTFLRTTETVYSKHNEFIPD